MKFFLAVLSIFTSLLLRAQTCTAPGQNPGTAFPVCGTSTFTQSSVPICGGRTVPNPSCAGDPLTDVNPYWYKFTCYQAGSLGFKITPNTNSEDYDWQLFDVTNRNPVDVYTDVNLVVGSNWSGEGGETGASTAGNQAFICAGLGKPLWSKMPNLVQGHQYLLLVSHFTQTQAGYSLSFGGGTAVITDNSQPHMATVETSCGGDILTLKLNKKIKCSSLASNGSDFFVTPAGTFVNNVVGIGCQSGFDTDSIQIHLSTFLAPGNYTLNIKNGSDGNTLLDYCDNPLPNTDKVNFTVFPLQPTPMDSLVPVQCKPQSLRLVFRKPILCNTIAPNGSDFSVSGPYPVSVTGATATCTGGTTREILVQLSQTLFNAGSFTLTLNQGNDGNTILDDCGQETPASSFIVFNVKDTVNALFSFSKFYGCVNDTVRFTHPGGNGVDTWNWALDDSKTSNQQNPVVLYNVFNNKNVSLVVSNGFCTDSSTQVVSLTNFLKADFSTFEDNCPNESIHFTSLAQGQIRDHKWSFGDGGTSTDESPDHTYAGPLNTTPYTVKYTVTDSIGCQSTAQKTIKIYSSCYLAVPSAFTPNGDGLNDVFGPLNAIKAEQLEFKIFNRWGQLIFQTKNWKQGWDGTLRNLPQGTGVYVWFLSYVDRDSRQKRQMKGTVTLIR